MRLKGKDCLALAAVLAAALLASSCQQQINYPAPIVSSLTPSSANAGQPAFTLTVTGSHLTPASTVLWNGQARISFFQDESHLTASILQSDIQNPGRAQVTVVTPQPGGGTSQPALDFTVNPVAVPIPFISSLSPSGVYASSGNLVLHVSGSNFTSTSVVTVNGANRPTVETNSSQLQAAINASDVANVGTLQIAVTNPPVPNPPAGTAPGGGTSNIVALNVTNPPPIITIINPTSALVGGAGSTSVSVTGTGLVPTSVVLFNGSPRVTAFGSTTSLTATLTAGDIAAAGSALIQVMNPAPDGGTSNALTFTINPSSTAGLPVLLDYAFDGSVSNSGICGTVAACSAGPSPLLFASGPAAATAGVNATFASISTNLLANQTTSGVQIFNRTTCVDAALCTPTTTLVGLGPNAVIPNGPSSEPSAAISGGSIAFTSTATNLTNYVPSFPSPLHKQIYWENVCGSAATCNGAVLVSAAADGLTPGNGDSFNASMSPDGSFVTFVSFATNLLPVSDPLITGSTPQVYLRSVCSGATPNSPSSTCTPTTYLISSPDGVTPANAASSHPVVASGGGYVAFQSSATNLATGATSGSQQIFVLAVCQILTPATCTTPSAPALVSSPDGSAAASSDSIEPAISSDGRFVAFASAATNLGAGGTNNNPGGLQQIFVRDTCISQTTCTPSTTLVSTSNGTTPANGLSESPSMSQFCSTTSTSTCPSEPLVAFASFATNLGSTASGVENIFVRNTCLSITSGNSCNTATKVASAPTGGQAQSGNSFMPSLASDGHTVAFLSVATNLVSAPITGGLVHAYLGATGF